MKPGRQKRLKLRIRNSPYRQSKQYRNRASRRIRRALREGLPDGH